MVGFFDMNQNGSDTQGGIGFDSADTQYMVCTMSNMVIEDLRVGGTVQVGEPVAKSYGLRICYEPAITKGQL